MSWSFDNTKPIYLQIMEKSKLQLVSHELEPNQQLPTERRICIQQADNWSFCHRGFGSHPSVPQTTFRGATATIRLLHASIWLQKRRTAKCIKRLY